MASAPSARPARVERYDCRWSGTPAQRPSVGVLGHGVVIGRSRQSRPALRISSARPPHPPSPHGLHLRMRFPSLPQRSQKQGMSKWWNACEHLGRCKPGIKARVPTFMVIPFCQWQKSNVFVQPYEQKPNLFGLCHGEKTKDEIQHLKSHIHILLANP